MKLTIKMKEALLLAKNHEGDITPHAAHRNTLNALLNRGWITFSGPGYGYATIFKLTEEGTKVAVQLRMKEEEITEQDIHETRWPDHPDCK